MEYVDRVSDAALERALGTFGAVLVEGPKWCGKTTSASRLAASELRIADPANGYQARRVAELDPATALRGARPRLVDEWQEVPSTWDAVRHECDRAGGAPGQFLLTGSATPRERDLPLHSGAGRVGRVRMDTMTLQELGASDGSCPLPSLFEGGEPSGAGRLSPGDLAELVCRGGWPATRSMPAEQAADVARAYVASVAEADLGRMDGVSRDPARVRRLIASLARNESTLATARALAADAAGPDGSPLAAATVADYLSALSKVFFVDGIPAWSPALRSPVRIRAAAKRHLADPSLAAAALGATPAALAGDPKTLGLLFESLAAHDLRVYARAMGAELRHYRDDSGLEVDLVVERPDGSWGAFEVKLGAAQEDAGAASVLALERKMVARGERPASAKAVVVGVGGVARVRPDGVAVVPIDLLGA